MRRQKKAKQMTSPLVPFTSAASSLYACQLIRLATNLKFHLECEKQSNGLNYSGSITRLKCTRISDETIVLHRRIMFQISLAWKCSMKFWTPTIVVQQSFNAPNRETWCTSNGEWLVSCMQTHVMINCHDEPNTCSTILCVNLFTASRTKSQSATFFFHCLHERAWKGTNEFQNNRNNNKLKRQCHLPKSTAPLLMTPSQQRLGTMDERVKAKWKEVEPITPLEKGCQLVFTNRELMEISREARNSRNTKNVW